MTIVPASPTDSILLVDDDPACIHVLDRILAGVGDLRFATCGEDALRIARESTPDLVLLDADMPGMSGFQVCAAFKADPALADVPIIFVTAHTDAAFEVSGFDFGAADFIAKPVSGPLVVARVKTQLRVKRLADELRRVATIDAVTGVSNRRRFDDGFAREWSRARRSGDPLAVLMIDVDHFKGYNDHHGHQAGDACLRSVARALAAATLRPGDLVARYGGDEFAVLLPQTSRSGAEHIARTMLDAVESLGMPFGRSPVASYVTATVGIGCHDATRDDAAASTAAAVAPEHHALGDPSELLRAADQALYAAKGAGRARAMLLDIADVGHPTRARDVGRLPPGRLQ